MTIEEHRIGQNGYELLMNFLMVNETLHGTDTKLLEPFSYEWETVLFLSKLLILIGCHFLTVS